MAPPPPPLLPIRLPTQDVAHAGAIVRGPGGPSCLSPALLVNARQMPVAILPGGARAVGYTPQHSNYEDAHRDLVNRAWMGSGGGKTFIVDWRLVYTLPGRRKQNQFDVRNLIHVLSPPLSHVTSLAASHRRSGGQLNGFQSKSEQKVFLTYYS